MKSQAPTMRLLMTSESQRLRFALMAAEHVERIGARIRRRREELELSQDDVARKMPGKTNGNAIYRWETGKHEPRPQNLQDLAEVLGVDVSYFLVAPADKTETPDPFATAPGDTPSDDLRERLQRIEDNQKHILAFLTRDLDAAKQAEINAVVDAQLQQERAEHARKSAAKKKRPADRQQPA